jgi:KDO2-lipid IV(A) lauroyltransferase
MFKRITYWFLRLAISFIAITPFSVLYHISDGLAFILHYLIRYRYRVIRMNFENSFPEKSGAEIKMLIKQFYQHFADIVLESLKGYSVPPEMLIPRYKFKPSPKLKQYYDNNQSVIITGGHYANWEWGVMCSGLQSQHHVMCYYHPIRNTFIDSFYREQFSTNRNLTTVSSKKAVRNFVEHRHEPILHMMLADQSPKSRNGAVWLDFLNQDTICITGPEKLAQKFNYPVFYFHVNRVKRGFYELQVIEITSNSKDTAKGEITTQFMRMLEQQIIDKPHEWLWSHKRWKKKRKIN